MKKVLMTLSIITLAILLVACGTESNYTDDENRDEVEITHVVSTGGVENEAGTSYNGGNIETKEVTEIFLTNPSRVAIFSYDALDMLDVVGIENTSISKIGVVKSNLPSFLTHYDSDDYENIGTLFMPDFDALDLFNPQLIIIGGRSSGAYDALKSAYPNANILDVSLTYGEYSEGLTRNVDNLGKIFPSVETTLDNELSEIIDDIAIIHEVAKNYEALFILVDGESLSFYGPSGRFAVLHDEFGFVAADPQAEEGGAHGNVVGYEYVAAVDPEVLFLLDRGSAIGGEGSVDTVIENSLIAGTKAGQNEEVYVLNGEAWYIAAGGFTSTQTMIDDLSDFQS